MRNDRECGRTTGGDIAPRATDSLPATPPRCPMPMPVQPIDYWAPHRDVLALAGQILALLTPRPAPVRVEVKVARGRR